MVACLSSNAVSSIRTLRFTIHFSNRMKSVINKQMSWAGRNRQVSKKLYFETILWFLCLVHEM